MKPFKQENVWISLDIYGCMCFVFLYVEIKTYCCHLLPIIWVNIHHYQLSHLSDQWTLLVSGLHTILMILMAITKT